MIDEAESGRRLKARNGAFPLPVIPVNFSLSLCVPIFELRSRFAAAERDKAGLPSQFSYQFRALVVMGDFCGMKTRLAFYLVAFFLLCYVSGSLSSLDSGGRVLNSWQEEKNDKQDSKVHCSRPRSRIARSILNEYLVPFLEQQKYNLSTKCRLHPENDMFQEQENQKDTVRPSQWQCNYCKKMFRSEEYLDKHFDNRHHEMLDMSPNHCLADVCGAIHCDFVTSQTKISKKKPCNRAAVDKNKHLCESLANSCFPTGESPTALRLHDFFLRQFCDTHTCSRGQKHFPRGSGKHKNRSLFYAFSLFTIILLLIFYVAVYLYQRDIAMNTTNLRRLAQHSVLKSQSGKRH